MIARDTRTRIALTLVRNFWINLKCPYKMEILSDLRTSTI